MARSGNVGAATVLSKLIERFWGHAVRTAYDGPTGLVAAEEFRPEVVLCDIGLPGMSGFDVAAQLRKWPATRSALLVALRRVDRTDAACGGSAVARGADRWL